jgi:hypothetical protein
VQQKPRVDFALQWPEPADDGTGWWWAVPQHMRRHLFAQRWVASGAAAFRFGAQGVFGLRDGHCQCAVSKSWMLACASMTEF